MVESNNYNFLNDRASGVLLPVFSLWSNYGIGTLGKSARELVDFLAENGQTYWQILPIHPTPSHNSPYSSFSSIAGNELFIDIDDLIDCSFLSKSDLKEFNFVNVSSYINYKLVRKSRDTLFKKVYNSFKNNIPKDYFDFCNKNSFWLDDYAIFMSIKKYLNFDSLDSWPDNYRLHDNNTIQVFANKHVDDIQYYKMLQYFFYKQWNSLKEYANSKNIYIIGDIPFYVAHDSSDVWSHPEVFKLDKMLGKTEVAGCPPDSFNKEGQLWGNPIYDWDYLKSIDYNWWRERIKQSFLIYDVLRIDHFRGFESYYTIDPKANSAKYGHWVKGPGIDFFHTLDDVLENKPIIAEDLGYVTDDVKNLLMLCNYPGMKILQFGFDEREPSSKDYLPYNFTNNCVVYTGNHDNNTICGWYEEVASKDLAFAKSYYDASSKHDLCLKMIYSIMGSVANICILCPQDFLYLGKEARINTPGTIANNWMWRLNHENFLRLKNSNLLDLTKLFGRLNRRNFKSTKNITFNINTF